MKPIQVGLLGIGTVGSGTFNVLERNQDEIRRRAGRGIEITMIADLDTERAKSVVGDKVKVVGDAREVIANPDIDVVVELIGGYGIAKALVLEAIQSNERDVPDYLEVDGKGMSAKFIRAPELAEVPYPVKMEPNLVVEFYAS